jgi:hypothetical protein
VPGTIVALDHQSGRVVEHVEIADRFAACSQRIEPAAAGPAFDATSNSMMRIAGAAFDACSTLPSS